MLQSSITSFEDEGISHSLKEVIKNNQYVAGYCASLLYVMNGLAECVVITESLHRKHKTLLTQMCLSEAIPIFTSTDDTNKYIPPEIEVLTVVMQK
ncbi:hypothetical protein CEE45_02815 [Candidatus Heimdallarchaeota archaeon B3_Heim]|nr:MAG: hypothetical protein CEE45_02815 [Candidatus Heimdallarchaeota archaeon B3_Heim]